MPKRSPKLQNKQKKTHFPSSEGIVQMKTVDSVLCGFLKCNLDIREVSQKK